MTDISKIKIGHKFKLECYSRTGEIKWTENFGNIVVSSGLDDFVARIYTAANLTVSDFVGLTAAAPVVAAGDTMAAHAGWSEVQAEYSEASRPLFVPGAVAGQSVDNSAAKAVFTFTGGATVGGCFLATDSTKAGTAGTLLAAGAFTGGDKIMASGDTLNVTVTATLASV